MNKFTLFVGLDVGKKDVYVSVRNAEEKEVFSSVFENEWEALSLLGLKLVELNQGEPSNILVALESCGTYAEKVTAELCNKGLFVWLLNPLLAKHAPLDLNRHKDDVRDAQAMGRLALLHHAKAKRFLPKAAELEKLSSLFALRKQLVKNRTQVFNQLHAHSQKANPTPTVIRVHEKRISQLSEQIAMIEAQLQACIDTTPAWKEMLKILCSIPGIGTVVATQFLELTHGFTRFQSERELAKYIGTMPLKHESGISVKRKPRSSQKTHKALKAHLTLGIISNLRKGGFYHQIYHQKIAEGKEHFYIINMIRNVILKLVFTLIKTGQMFDHKHFLENKLSWK